MIPFLDVMNIQATVLEYLKVVISWPVAVLVVVLFLRKQLIELLNGFIARLKDVSEASVGSATFKFTKTQIGTIHAEVNASATPVGFGSSSHSFRSEPFGFEISYPIGRGWIEHLEAEENVELLKKLDVPGKFLPFLVNADLEILLSRPEHYVFQPNVNVLLEPILAPTVAEYVAASLKTFSELGWKLTSYEVDSKTNAASFSYEIPPIEIEKNPERTLALECVARVIIPKDLGLAYVATLTTQKGVDLPKKLTDDLVRILNSFTVFKSAARPDSDKENAKDR